MNSKLLAPIFGLVLVSLVWVGGCGGSNNNPSAQVTPAASPSGGALVSNWSQLTETIRCESLDDSHCQGFYGFTVASNGVFNVGPADDNLVLTGNLTSAELAMVNTDSNAVVSAGAESSSPDCQPSNSQPGSSDQIIMTFMDQNTAAIYDRSLQQICYRGGITAAQKLQFDFSQLLQKYYPIPFPSPSPQPSPSVSPSPSQSVQNGRWGTQGAYLDVNSNGGTMYFNCLKGSLDETLVLDNDNSFDVTGTVINQSGPIIVGHPHLQQPAEFFGSVNGNLMNITVNYLDDEGQSQSSHYSLIYGNPGKLNLCAT